MCVGFGFSSVTFRSRFSIPAFSVTPALTWANRVLEVARIFTKHSKCCDKFFVLTMSLYAFISLLYKQLLQYTLLKSFTVPSAVLTKFAKKFHTKLLASAFIFTKLCLIWVSSAIAKHARVVLTAFCQCSRFIVNGITEVSQHIAGVQRDVNTSQKRRRRDADTRSAAAAAARRTALVSLWLVHRSTGVMIIFKNKFPYKMV